MIFLYHCCNQCLLGHQKLQTNTPILAMCSDGERIQPNTCTKWLNNKKKTQELGSYTHILTLTRKWTAKRRNPSLDDSDESQSLTMCYTHKYIRLRQETGQVTTRDEVTRDNCQLTDTCSFAGQLTDRHTLTRQLQLHRPSGHTHTDTQMGWGEGHNKGVLRRAVCNTTINNFCA
jgi:hypothetical protein